MYKVRFSKYALRDLRKMDKSIAAMLMGWIQKNLDNCADPRIHGKPLVGNSKEKWRYQVGDYRILAYIDDLQITILVLTIGHRRDIYK